jgi:transcriptional antiterminator RfaH
MQQRRALVNLAQQGFECFAPRIMARVVKQFGRSRVLVNQPQFLFDRYFFVQLVAGWRAITGTRGVSEVLLDPSRQYPMTISEREISLLKLREGSDGFIRVQRGKIVSQFKRGDRLRVTEGQFIGLSAVFEAATQQDRVAVLLSMMGRQVKVELEAADVIRA